MAGENKIFVKVYVDAVHGGMIGDMGAERWQTLCVIASFMDINGECYPTQDLIAHRLGIARETANRRIQKLLKYRWKGEPVIEAKTLRHPTEKTWWKTVYKVLPNSGITIFDADVTRDTSHGKRHNNKNHINENYIN